MYFINDFCVVCLYKKNDLKTLLEQDEDGVSYYFKLTTCFTQMKFKELNKQRCICDECLTTLNVVYNYFQTCIKSKTTLLQCISKLSSICQKTGKMCVFSVDFKKNNKDISVPESQSVSNETSKTVLQNRRKRKLPSNSTITKEYKNKENNVDEQPNDNELYLPSVPSTSTSNFNSEKRQRKDYISTSDKQNIIDTYNEILQNFPRRSIAAIVTEIVENTGLPKSIICRIIKENRELSEQFSKKQFRQTSHIEDVGSLFESVKKVIDNLENENGYPSVYQVYREIKNQKNIPRTSQSTIYKIMKQIANEENSNQTKSNNSNNINDESNETDLNYSNDDNYIEHIEVKPEIILDDYEQEFNTMDIKTEPENLNFKDAEQVEHVNLNSNWSGQDYNPTFHDPLSNEYLERF